MSRSLPPKLLEFVCASVLVSAGPVGCRRKTPEGVGVEAPASATASQALRAPARCAEVARGTVFTVGDAETGASEDEEAKGLPFAIELGAASAWAGGFVVGAQRARDGGTSALVALTGKEGGSGRIVELGAVHGNVGVPRGAARGNDVIAVVPDGDGTGTRLRLCAIRDPAGRADVVWGAELPEGRDDSDEFDVAIGDQAGLVVWDEWASADGQSQIKASTFEPKDVAKATKPRVISTPKSDVEGPQLSVRPGGFWLAFLAHEAEKTRGPRAASSARPEEDEIEGSVLDLGRRWLRVVPLDANGSPSATPVGVTAEEMHVIVFDLATLPDGAALLAWRNDDTSPGVEGGTVHLARVAPDGTVTRGAVEGREVGAGVPGLIIDAAHGQVGAWLAMAGVGDDTALGALGREGKPLDDLESDPVVRSAEPIALDEGRLLIARPKGLSVELSVVRCRPGTLGSTAATPASAPEPLFPVDDLLP